MTLKRNNAIAHMSFQNTVKYLDSFVNYEKWSNWSYQGSFKLKRFRDFLSLLKDPHKGLKCVHVAGSKGKGSTCAFIAYVLKEAGYRVGLYTSPHLSDIRERIRLLEPSLSLNEDPGGFDGMISRPALSRLTGKIKAAVGIFKPDPKEGELSFFEIYTALAFLYFKEKKADFVVLETGLGGRLDATNVVDPLVSVITPISLEHTHILGKRLKDIASEKAGIIKTPHAHLLAGNLAISAPQAKEVLEVLSARCKETGIPLKIVGRDIMFSRLGSRIKIKGLFCEYKGLKVPLLGEHQVVNAASAIGALEGLRNFGFKITEAAVRDGISKTRWPGRCEISGRRPYIILDGAQNSASARALKKTVENVFKYGKLVLVLGISQDKDIKGVCSELKPLADLVVLTRSDNPRAANPEDLKRYFRGKKIVVTGGTKEAYAKAVSLTGKNDLVLVTGSLFLVGEFRALHKQAGKSLEFGG